MNNRLQKERIMGLTHKQIILVGDSGCGKSALALRLTHSLFSESYIPTEFESHVTELVTEDGFVKLTLQDVSGTNERSEVRKLVYEGCDFVLLCFDVTDKISYESLETRWVPEISSMAPGVPVFIAACKRDKPEAENVVSQSEVEELVVRIGAAGYLECSASTNENVELLFHQILETKAPKQQSNIKKIIQSVRPTKKSLRRLYSSI